MSEVTAEQLRETRQQAFTEHVRPIIDNAHNTNSTGIHHAGFCRACAELHAVLFGDVAEEIANALLLANAPLTLAALQAGAEERKPDYEAALDRLIKEDAYMASGFGMTTVRKAFDDALGNNAVVLVPRSQ